MGSGLESQGATRKVSLSASALLGTVQVRPGETALDHSVASRKADGFEADRGLRSDGLAIGQARPVEGPEDLGSGGERLSTAPIVTSWQPSDQRTRQRELLPDRRIEAY